MVRLGPRDSGKAVELSVGDQLVIALTSTRLQGRWALRGYPRPALRVDLSNASFAQFVFVAQAAGAGTVTLVRAACTTRFDAPCLGRPVDPPAATDPARDYTVAVRVT